MDGEGGVSRRAAIVFLVCFCGLLVVTAAARATLDVLLEPHHRDGHLRTIGRGQVAFDHHGGEYWWNRYRREHRAVRNLAALVRLQRRQLARLKTGRSLQSAAPTSTSSVPQIICVVFPDCTKALSVARCESGFRVTATNGQYFGVFQMGSAERARFGGSTTDPWDQVRAAYAYFRVAGWAPWQCA